MKVPGSHHAIVLIDPVSSGRFLKSYVAELGYHLIGVFTLSEEELKLSGKFIPYQEKIEYCERVIHSSDFDLIAHELDSSDYKIVAVIPASEPAVELADQLADYFQLKGNPVSSSSARRDKYMTRQAVKEASLPSPDFAACYTKKDVEVFISKNGLPVVLKTPKGAGAHHVFVCHHLTQAYEAFHLIVGGKNIFGQSTSFALIEEFIRGQQYIVEMFGDGEKLHLLYIWRFDFLTDSQSNSIFHKIELIRDRAELLSLQEVSNYALAVGEAIGIRIGPCLAEIRYEPGNSPLLIEVGARLSGIDLPLLVREVSNFDPFKATIQVYTSGMLIRPVHFHQRATLLFFSVEGVGYVKEIEGIDRIKELPSYVHGKINIQINDHIEGTFDLAAIPYYVYLAHEDKNQVEKDERIAKELFKIKLEDPTVFSQERKSSSS